MADSASELESDCSSVDGVSKNQMALSKEQMQKRIESLHQESKVLKVELETYKLRCKNLIEENKSLRKASVTIQAKAEQEEEFISNMLLKKIQVLKKEKEALAMNYEQEEEFLTNDLSRKLIKLKEEKVQLEKTLEQEQELQVNKLLKKIKKLESETSSKQANLDQLRREKIELENTLEQEQEALVNKLWKRMERLEAEKRILQEKLDQPLSEPPSPQPSNSSTGGPSQAEKIAKNESAMLSRHVQHLKTEVSKLKKQLETTRTTQDERMDQLSREEHYLRNESLNIRQKFLEETAYARALSESESSVDNMSEDDSTTGGGVSGFGGGPFGLLTHQSPRGSLKSHNRPSPASHGSYHPPYQVPPSKTGGVSTPLGSRVIPNSPSPPCSIAPGWGQYSMLHTNSSMLRRSVSPMNIVPLTCNNAQSQRFLANHQQTSTNSQHHLMCPHCGIYINCQQTANGQATSHSSSNNHNNNLTPNAHAGPPNQLFTNNTTNINNPSVLNLSSLNSSNITSSNIKKRSPSAELFAKPPLPPPSYTFTSTPSHLISSTSSSLSSSTNSGSCGSSSHHNLSSRNLEGHYSFGIGSSSKISKNSSNISDHPAPTYNTPPNLPSNNGDKCPATLTKQLANPCIPGGTRFKPLILKNNINDFDSIAMATATVPIDIPQNRIDYGEAEDDDANKTPPSNNTPSFLTSSSSVSGLLNQTNYSLNKPPVIIEQQQQHLNGTNSTHSQQEF